MTVPEAIQHPALRRYALRCLRLPLGGAVLPLALPDAQDWRRRGQWAEATARGAEPPYWVQVWPASVALARLLWRFQRLEGQRVLDLGCGLGIPGIAAARLGALVTFADREQDALHFAQWNATRMSTAAAAPATQRIDWSRDVVAGRFDFVLLADVSYRTPHHAPLRRQLEHALAPGGCIVHADPMRAESRVFLSELEKDFATLETTKVTHFGDKRIEVRLVVAARERDDLARWTNAVGLAARRAHGEAS